MLMELGKDVTLLQAVREEIAHSNPDTGSFDMDKLAAPPLL